MLSPQSGPIDAASAERARWFAEEIQSHESAVRGYLRNQFPSLDTDDVVQESYLKILRSKAVDPIRSTKAYFFSIARNTALTIFRRRKIYSETPVNGLPDSRVVDPAPNAAENADHNQRTDMVVEAIDRLPGRCQEIVKLVALEGLSTAEVAFRLGISQPTVRVQMARGIKKCASYWAERQGNG